MTLKQAIRDNQRFFKYENMLRRIRLNVFEYEDAGKTDKANRIIDKIKQICYPRWQARRERLARKVS